MKYFLFSIIFCFLTSPSSAQEKTLYKVYRIDCYEKDEYVIFIINNTEKGIIVMGNDSLLIDKSFKKIELNHEYSFDLQKQESNFRGELDGYAVITSSGNRVKIWTVKKDGPIPSIYKAKNVKEIFIRED